MSFVTPYALFKVIRITSFFQHFIIVVGFKECRMTFTEMMDHIFTWNSDISKHAHVNPARGYNEAIWIRCIMMLRKRMNFQSPNQKRLVRLKTLHELPVNK